MKKLGILVLGLVVSVPVWSQKTGEIPIEFSNPQTRGKLEVDITKGTVTVLGTSRKNVLVKYTLHTQGKEKQESRSDGLKRIDAAAANLEIYEQNNVVKVDTDWSSKGIDFVIEVPSDIDLKLDTYNQAAIVVKNIKGELELDSYNGPITAENISGSVIADTYNGKIMVTFDAIKPDTPMAFATYNGDVDLTLPSGFKANMKMRTARGEILSGFDIDLIKSEPVQRKNDGGVQKVYLDEWVRGKINGGGPEFMIKNYNGDIYLRKK